MGVLWVSDERSDNPRPLFGPLLAVLVSVAIWTVVIVVIRAVWGSR